MSTTPDTDADQTPTREEIFDLLSNERRQCALYYLLQADEMPVDLGDLVDYVAAWENDAASGVITGDARKRVYTSLRQSHLPRLERAGLLEFRDRRGTITLTDTAEEVRSYIEEQTTDTFPWHQHYLALSIVSGGSVLLYWLGISPVDAISPSALMGAIVIAFLLSAVVQTVRFVNRGAPSRYEVEGL